MSRHPGVTPRPSADRGKERHAVVVGLALFLAAAVSSCTGPLKLSAGSQGARPEIQEARIEVLSLGMRTAELRLHLRIDNPGGTLEGGEARLEWTLEDVRFASSRHGLSLPWPARQVSEQTIDVSLAFFSLPFTEFSGAPRRDDFHLVVQGELSAGPGDRRIAIPISAQTSISRPKDR